MFEFYRIRYISGKITKEELRTKVPKFITSEEFEIITGEIYI